MRRLWCSGVLAAAVGAVVANASVHAPTDSITLEEADEEEPFILFGMTEKSNDKNEIAKYMSGRLGLARAAARGNVVDEAIQVLRTCYSDAPLMTKYIKFRPEERVEPQTGLMDDRPISEDVETDSPHNLYTGERRDLDWGVFDLPFETGGNRLSYVEDLAWAVKSVVDVYDTSPLCREALSKREGRSMRLLRKVGGFFTGKWTKRNVIDTFLVIALHKALYDWAVLHGQTSIFSGEDIPFLVATAREARTMAGKLARLEKRMSKPDALRKKVMEMKSVIASQYLSNLGRAYELMRWRLWELQNDSSTPSPSVVNTRSAEDLLVSARLFMTLTQSLYPHIGLLISQTADAIGEDILGNMKHRHAIVPTLPCPTRADGKFYGGDGKPFFSVYMLVYKFNGAREGIDSSTLVAAPGGNEEESPRNDEAENALVEVLRSKSDQFLRDLFGPEADREHLNKYVRTLFPSKCFKNMKQVRQAFPDLAEADYQRLVVKVPRASMSGYARTMKKIVRSDKEKLRDVSVKTGKIAFVKSALKGALATGAIVFGVGVAVVGIACAAAMAALATPLASIPGCLLAAISLGWATWFVVAPALSFAAIGLGGLSFAISTSRSIASALKFIITPMIESKRRMLHDLANNEPSRGMEDTAL